MVKNHNICTLLIFLTSLLLISCSKAPSEENKSIQSIIDTKEIKEIDISDNSSLNSVKYSSTNEDLADNTSVNTTKPIVSEIKVTLSRDYYDIYSEYVITDSNKINEILSTLGWNGYGIDWTIPDDSIYCNYQPYPEIELNINGITIGLINGHHGRAHYSIGPGSNTCCIPPDGMFDSIKSILDN